MIGSRLVSNKLTQGLGAAVCGEPADQDPRSVENTNRQAHEVTVLTRQLEIWDLNLCTQECHDALETQDQHPSKPADQRVADQ